jgi:hypothetical protein
MSQTMSHVGRNIAVTPSGAARQAMGAPRGIGKIRR